MVPSGNFVRVTIFPFTLARVREAVARARAVVVVPGRRRFVLDERSGEVPDVHRRDARRALSASRTCAWAAAASTSCAVPLATAADRRSSSATHASAASSSWDRFSGDEAALSSSDVAIGRVTVPHFATSARVLCATGALAVTGSITCASPTAMSRPWGCAVPLSTAADRRSSPGAAGLSGTGHQRGVVTAHPPQAAGQLAHDHGHRPRERSPRRILTVSVRFMDSAVTVPRPIAVSPTISPDTSARKWSPHSWSLGWKSCVVSPVAGSTAMIREPFRREHETHASARFSSVVTPPAARGATWSTWNVAS